MLFKCQVAVWERKWGFEIPETDFFFFLKALLLSDVNSLPCSSVLVLLFSKVTCLFLLMKGVAKGI